MAERRAIAIATISLVVVVLCSAGYHTIQNSIPGAPQLWVIAGVVASFLMIWGMSGDRSSIELLRDFPAFLVPLTLFLMLHPIRLFELPNGGGISLEWWKC